MVVEEEDQSYMKHLDYNGNQACWTSREFTTTTSTSSTTTGSSSSSSSSLLLLQGRERTLREFIRNRPRNGRAMSDLACVLHERHQQQQRDRNISNCIATISNNKKLGIRCDCTSNAGAAVSGGIMDDSSTHVHKEAMEWADKACQVAPTKPYGWAAVSIVHPIFTKRMEALQKAIDLSQGNPLHAVAIVGMLIRILIESRSEEQQQQQQNRKRINSNYQGLNEKESYLYYERIRPALVVAWKECQQRNEPAISHIGITKNSDGNNNSTTIQQQQQQHSYTRNNNNNNSISKQIEYLAQREYRLGLLFRKMEPRNQLYQSIAQYHFQQAKHNLPKDHTHSILSHFWLATLLQNNNKMNHENHTNATTTTVQTNDDRINDDNQRNVHTTVTRCPPEYIIGLYATFAERFDTLLVNKLQYATPTLLHDLVIQQCKNDNDQGNNNNTAATAVWTTGADLGCGTGLSGKAFRSCIQGKLIGVDLSREMIAQATSRGCYDELVVGDLSTILINKPNEYNIIFSCDVLVYIGDLSQIFLQVHTSLMNNGIFAFSTELLILPPNDEDCSNNKNNTNIPTSNTSSTPSYQLQSSGRFAHQQSYIESLVSSHNHDHNCCWHILTIRICPIRKNLGHDVIGMLCVLKKKGLGGVGGNGEELSYRSSS